MKNEIHPMAEIHWGKKWKRPRGRQEVLLTVERCVVKVGYDWDMEAARKELLEEAGKHRAAPIEEILHHADFDGFKEKAQEILDLLHRALGHARAIRVYDKLRREAAHEAVRKRLESKQWSGAERSLHFGPIEGNCWEGPWRVLGKRRAVTGTYVAASGGGYGYDYEYEPPDLVNRKTHVLLLAQRGMTFERVVLLESDTCDWANKEIAERLMQEA